MTSAASSVGPQPTGNLLMLMEPGADVREIDAAVANVSGGRVVHSSDFRSMHSGIVEAFEETGVLSLDRIGVAVLAGGRMREAGVALEALSAIPGVRRVRPEFWMYAVGSWDERYGTWVRDGLGLLLERAGGLPSAEAGALPKQPIVAASAATWGLAATGADRSPYAGKGIKVAILDTGLDMSHPDFRGRTIVAESFVPGDPDPQDVQGHGTHCAGTACGPQAPSGQARYGIAFEADIYVGKVLNDSGSGHEGWILAGMEWAVESGCEVISMSLGRAVQPGEPPDEEYEKVGKYALDNNSLIIAAAGNESWREYNIIKPVGAPANSKSILAVGAVDSKMKIANFSCGGINPGGGEVNIAGPGVDVLSTVPMPRRYLRLSGTSMASPHAAGIAALLAQSDPALRGHALWQALVRNARQLGLAPGDAGAGLVVAPGGAASA